MPCAYLRGSPGLGFGCLPALGGQSALPPPHPILLPVTRLFSRQPKGLPGRLIMPAVKGFNCIFFS